MSDLADIIADALDGTEVGDLLGFSSATLRIFTAGTRGAQVAAGTNPTSVEHACTASREEFTRRKRIDDGSGMGEIDVSEEVTKITILGASIPGVRPKSGNEIDFDGTTYNVVRVTGDGARGVWTCEAMALAVA